MGDEKPEKQEKADIGALVIAYVLLASILGFGLFFLGAALFQQTSLTLIWAAVIGGITLSYFGMKIKIIRQIMLFISEISSTFSGINWL